MARKKTTSKKPARPRRKLTAVTDADIDAAIADVLAPPPPAPDAGLATLHDMFSQQTRAVLENADLDEEQKQSILLAMSCPCCGGGVGSFSLKLKRKV